MRRRGFLGSIVAALIGRRFRHSGPVSPTCWDDHAAHLAAHRGLWSATLPRSGDGGVLTEALLLADIERVRRGR